MDENANNNSAAGLLVATGALIYTNAFPEISDALGKVLFFLLFCTWRVIDAMEGLTEDEKNERKLAWVTEFGLLLEHLRAQQMAGSCVIVDGNSILSSKERTN